MRYKGTSVEECADTLYSHYGTFDRAIAVASREVAIAATLAEVEFYADVICKLAKARNSLGLETCP